RLYDVQEGTVEVGGRPVQQLRLEGLRQQIGLVTQDVQLFQATVRENLALFDPEILDEQILETLDVLGLMDWYGTLSDGLDTVLASGSGGLSAGEGQLLVFARVFLKDPGLVILDEPSSRLDPATEQRINQAVGALLKERTGIIIAHRLATVQRVDEIMILEDGEIREFGIRESLTSDPNSRFSKLLKTGLEEVLG
ncbi:MAG: ATP-binding cassette domain-containing protein, partial [bacterium]|nr:ATP-binding cassette domain-containing protein [bacterium]